MSIWPFSKKTTEESEMYEVMDEDTQFDDELNDEEVEDDFSDVDDDTKARFDKYIAKQQKDLDSKLMQARQGLQTVGLDLGDDGQVAIKDLRAAQSYFSPAVETSQVIQQTIQDEDDEWSDPVLDTEKYDKKFKKEVAKEVAKATEVYIKETQLLKQAMLEDKIDQAVIRVEDAINKYAPLYAEILEHPQFETMFREALSNTSMEYWRDGRSLAKFVGMIGVDLPQVERLQRKSKVVPQEQVRSSMNRQTLGQISPSKGSTSKQTVDYSDIDRETAALLGVSLDQAKALGSKSDVDKGFTPERAYREAREVNGKRGK